MAVRFRGQVRRWQEDSPGGLAVVDLPTGSVAQLGGRRMDARGITEAMLTKGARHSTLDELRSGRCGPSRSKRSNQLHGGPVGEGRMPGHVAG
jgi:hypothetical protein